MPPERFLNCVPGVRVTPGAPYKNLRRGVLLSGGVWLRLGCVQLPSGVLDRVRESFDVVSVGAGDERRGGASARPRCGGHGAGPDHF